MADRGRFGRRDPRRFAAKGAAALDEGRIDEAVAEFEKAVLADPGQVAWHLELGDALARSGRSAQARRVFEHADGLEPGRSDVAKHLAGLGGPTSQQDPVPGTVLHGREGDYEVRKVMRGGHGTVLVVELRPGAAGPLRPGTYALKTFQRGRLARSGERERFARELRTWVSLPPHPNVATALWVERIEGVPGVLTDYVAPGDLAARIGGEGLPVDLALRFALQLCAGLEHAQRNLKIAHGDVKPGNCLVTADDTLRLTDFGLAQAFGRASVGADLDGLSDELRRIYHPALGAPGYRAPEQLDADARIDVLTDVYSFGVVLYEMLTGRRPPSGSVALAHMQAGPPGADVPDALVEIMHKCVAPYRGDRPVAFRAVHSDLAGILSSVTGEPATTLPAGPGDSTDSRLRRGVGFARLGDVRDGADLLGEVLDEDREHRHAAVHIGRLLAGLGRAGEAMEHLERALTAAPGDPELLAAKGVVVLEGGDPAEALAELDRAVLAGARMTSTGCARARAQRALGRPVQALRTLDEVLREHPRDDEALLLRGAVQADLNRFPEALTDLRTALEIDPASTDASCEQVRPLLVLGPPADAVRAFETGTEADRDRPGRRFAYARALRADGSSEEALTEMRLVHQSNPADDAVRYELVDLLRALGQHDEAHEIEHPKPDPEPDPVPPSEPVPAPVPPEPSPPAPRPEGNPGGEPDDRRPVPSGRAEFSLAVGVCLQLARAEAGLCGSELVEPVHLLLGAGKLCDVDLAAVHADMARLAQVEREVAVVRALFEDCALDVTRFRRRLRSLVAVPSGRPAAGTPRRSSRSRDVFTRARDAADGEYRVTLEHLLAALLPVLVDHRATEPRECLRAFGVALDEAGRSARPASASRQAESLVPEASGPAAIGPDAGGGWLDRLGRDLTALAADGRLGAVVGREAEIRALSGALVRATKCNALLLGEPGVGKTAVVEALALAVAGDAPPPGLAGVRIVELSLTALVADTTYRGQFEERLRAVLAEADPERVVLFIDEVHMVLGAGGSRGGLDVAGILKPALARGEIRLIGATTDADHRRYVESDAALVRRFHTIRVQEPGHDDAVRMVGGAVPRLERHHQVQVTGDAVRTAVTLSVRYLPELRLPDKAIDLLDEACAHARPPTDSPPAAGPDTTAGPDDAAAPSPAAGLHAAPEHDAATGRDAAGRDAAAGPDAAVVIAGAGGAGADLAAADRDAGRPVVGAEAVLAVTAERCRVPVERLRAGAGGVAAGLADELAAAVAGQGPAVDVVTGAVQTLYAGLADPDRPGCALVFAGPPGTGKTTLAYALARALSGPAAEPVHVDLGEYGEEHSVSRLLGSPPGYLGHDSATPVLDRVRADPHAVVLFDSVQRAHPRVLESLRAIVDRGSLTGPDGRTISFAHAVVVFAVTTEPVAAGGLGFGTPPGRAGDPGPLHRALADVLPAGILGRCSAVPFAELDDRAAESVVDRALASPRDRLAARGLELTLSADARAELTGAVDRRTGAHGVGPAVERIVTRPLAAAVVAGLPAGTTGLHVERAAGVWRARAAEADG